MTAPKTRRLIDADAMIAFLQAKADGYGQEMDENIELCKTHLADDIFFDMDMVRFRAEDWTVLFEKQRLLLDIIDSINNSPVVEEGYYEKVKPCD